MVSGDSSQNRVFHYAVLASLVLHGLLLFGIPDLVDTARRVAALPQPLIARLMAPEPVAAPPPPPPAAEKKVEKKIERAKPPPRLARPVPAPEPTPLPTPRVEQPAPPVESPQPPAPVPAPPVVSTAPQAASPSVQPSAPVAAAPAPESLSRDEYRLQLIDEARRHKRYPPVARENNWEGVVGISIAVAAGGRPTVTLKSSSGYEVIDRQALDMFRQAARAVPVPPALRGNAFALDLRIRYALED